MIPEDNPDDEYEHYQCELCDKGSIRLSEDKTAWECSGCDFRAPNKQMKFSGR